MELKLSMIIKNDPVPDKEGELSESYTLSILIPGTHHTVFADVSISDDDIFDKDAVEEYKSKMNAVSVLCKSAKNIEDNGKIKYYKF